MINIEIISRKLLFISTTLSLLILFILLISFFLRPKYLIVLCNKEDKINVFLQINNFDILINPIGEKQVLECLGKSMVFYDRTIDVVMSTNKDILASLMKRYTISRVIPSTSLKIDNFNISNDSKVHISSHSNEIVIYQRFMKTIQHDNKSNVISIYPLDEDNEAITVGDLILKKDQLLMYQL